MVSVTDSYIRRYLARPGQTLVAHTTGVLNRAAILLNGDHRARTSAIMHDVGKIINRNFTKKWNPGRMVDGLYTNHSYLSMYTLFNYIRANGYKTGVVENQRDLLTMAITVCKHHGGLPNLVGLLNDEELDRMFAYLATGHYNTADGFLSFMELDGSIQPFRLDLARSRLQSVFSMGRLRGIIGPEESLDFFLDLRMNFSATVASDKYDAGSQGLTDDNMKRMMAVYGDRVDSYIRNKRCNPTAGSAELNRIRTEIQTMTVSRLEDALERHPDQRIFSLTEPTGSGKTFVLMSSASAILRAKFSGLTGEGRWARIIYSIPFLSITEQIFNIIDEMFPGQDEKDCIKRIDYKADSGLELLSEEDEARMIRRIMALFRKILKGKTVKEENAEKILKMDYQESTFDFPLIVTTFVQLFQSFTTSSNRGLMRFHNLRDSIFLIDEIQSLPPRLYSFFIAMLDAFCRKFNSYAIVSTATMPMFRLPSVVSRGTDEIRRIFRDYHPPLEIGDLSHFANPVFNRYTITSIKERLTIATLSERVLRETKSTAAVLNTKRDSIRLYNLVRERADCPVFLLNTLFYSDDRTAKLDEVKRLLGQGRKVYLITTQVVEAGVDIDFDILYRDIAPVPNLQQAFGRLNRNDRRSIDQGVGIGYVFALYDDDLIRLRARTIYNGEDGPFLDFAIEAVINSPKERFEEREFFELQQSYFEGVADRTRFGQHGRREEDNFVRQIKDFRYGDMGQFRLISEQEYGDQVQFYVPKSDDDESYEKLVALVEEKAALENSFAPAPKDVILKMREIFRHRRTMMGRVVQVNLDGDEIAELSVYSEPVFKILKLKPGRYDSERGLHTRKEG